MWWCYDSDPRSNQIHERPQELFAWLKNEFWASAYLRGHWGEDRWGGAGGRASEAPYRNETVWVEHQWELLIRTAKTVSVSVWDYTDNLLSGYILSWTLPSSSLSLSSCDVWAQMTTTHNRTKKCMNSMYEVSCFYSNAKYSKVHNYI